MPYYKVTYKLTRIHYCSHSLGPFPNRDAALAHFNNTYARKKISPFTFEKKICSHVLEYYLVEQQQTNGPEVKTALCTLPR
jgi:hypothetical protein